jgi:hypothetical protein
MSLSLVIRQILDKIGPQNSFFPTETLDITLPGTSTPESISLEECIRSLVARLEELEQETIYSEGLDAATRSVPKQLRNVNNGDVKKHVCLYCGHRLDGVPLTPEETPVVDKSGLFVPKSSFVPC